MKRLAALLASLAVAAAPFAATAADSSAAHGTSGVVKSVNVEKGTVSIAHAPVPELNWPAMTMNFSATDRRLLQNLEPGAKVEFEFVREGSRYVITSIK